MAADREPETRDNAPQAGIASADGDGVLTRFQELLPVVQIATARERLETCVRNEPVAAVLARNAGGFDFWPVREDAPAARGAFVGLFDTRRVTDRAPDALVSEIMAPLDEDNLIGGDASILDFIRSGDRQPCRLVVSGARVSGLVTLSDLQKLPVRAALFALVTHLEMTMAAAIRRECPAPDQWQRRMSSGRRDGLADKIAASTRADSMVDALEFTDFADKRQILMKSDRLQVSKRRFEAELKAIEDLRNPLAHAGSYAETRDEALRLCGTVRAADEWVDTFSNWARGL